MGRHVFRVPDVGEGTAEVEVIAWHVAVGDVVEEDQPLADLMTEKATVEIPSPVSGRVLALMSAPGQMAAVGSPLIEIEVEGVADAGPVAERTPEYSEPASTRSPIVEVEPPVGLKAPAKPPGVSPPSRTLAIATRTPGETPVASPAVRAKAIEAGVKLQFVPGSGPGGRITHEDLDAFITSSHAWPATSQPSRQTPNATVEDVPVLGLRRRIARQMQESKRRIPHFSYVEEVDVADLESLRIYMNEARKPGQPKLTVLPFIIRALVLALPDFPQINARFDDEAGVVHRHRGVHVGVATQTAGGLIVPVVRHAETLDVWGLAGQVARLAEATRSGKAKREELSGSTITVTSLGPLGGLSHTPVINHPEVAIIGPNKIIDRPVIQGGAVVARKMMNISSSFDHRVVDGWHAAEFIQRIRALLERPALLFMDAA
jgi:2-oxoisovalerate dehydrogenase E2 component (dihydrolipoyl transacylase)